jgi:glycosyltransferase involved in cell wall biosynthesis
MNIRLSIVVIEYKSIEEILHCVASLDEHVRVPYEVIVSSNSCYTPEERRAIPHSGDRVRWLFNERNGGFAYAMNEGLRMAKGDYMVIMNSDCTPMTDLDGMTELWTHPEMTRTFAENIRSDYYGGELSWKKTAAHLIETIHKFQLCKIV